LMKENQNNFSPRYRQVILRMEMESVSPTR
jgi:hypothetical protein